MCRPASEGNKRTAFSMSRACRVLCELSRDNCTPVFDHRFRLRLTTTVTLTLALRTRFIANAINTVMESVAR